MANCKKTCQCGLDLNLGVKETAEFKAARFLGLMEYTNSSGEVNNLDLTADWNTAFWEGLISQGEFANRLQILKVDEWTPTTEDPLTVARKSGKVTKVRDGVTNFELYVDNADAVLYDALKAMECKRIGFIIEDSCGSIGGKECEDNKLNVIEIEKDTLNVNYIFHDDSDIQRLRITFTLALNESPVLTVVPSSEIENPMGGIDSICDAVAIGTPTATTTQAVISLEAKNAFGKKEIPAEGLDTPANWTITDSAGATSNPTTVTEAPAGTYTIDYAIIPTGVTGYKYLDTDFEAIVNITIP